MAISSRTLSAALDALAPPMIASASNPIMIAWISIASLLRPHYLMADDGKAMASLGIPPGRLESSEVGPGVRILLPPAVSLVRT
jgi:hypothetical protein